MPRKDGEGKTVDLKEISAKQLGTLQIRMQECDKGLDTLDKAGVLTEQFKEYTRMTLNSIKRAFVHIGGKRFYPVLLEFALAVEYRDVLRPLPYKFESGKYREIAHTIKSHCDMAIKDLMNTIANLCYSAYLEDNEHTHING